MRGKATWADAAVIAVGNLACLTLIFGSIAAWHYWNLPGFATCLLAIGGMIGLRVAAINTEEKKPETEE